MAHTIKNRNKTVARVNRLKGQLDAFTKTLESESECYKSMQILASCRGALNGLMKDFLNEHVREHIVNAPTKKKATEAGDEIIEIMECFWK